MISNEQKRREILRLFMSPVERVAHDADNVTPERVVELCSLAASRKLANVTALCIEDGKNPRDPAARAEVEKKLAACWRAQCDTESGAAPRVWGETGQA